MVRAMQSGIDRVPGRVLGRWWRTDAFALALVFASFAVGMVLTWQRWGTPLIDCGREMNQPLRLLRGEWLYGDVTHFYGPLAPVVNAGLYRVFGASLDTLRSSGLVATLVVLAATYWLARQLMGRAGAALSAVSVTWLCALSLLGNFLLPYSYAAVYGAALALLSLVLGVRGLRSGRIVTVVASALLTALAFLAKTETGVAALAGGLSCVVLASIPPWRAAVLRVAVFLATAVGVPAATYAWIAGRVGWTPLLDEGHLLYQHLPRSAMVFSGYMFGLDRPVHSLLMIFAVALRLALGASLLSWLALRPHPAHSRRASQVLRLAGWLAAAVVAIGLAAGFEGGPYLAVPVILLALIGFHGRRLWLRLRSRGHARGRPALGFVLAVFALVSLARIILRVRSSGSYTAYLMPAAIVLFTYVWCALLPALMPTSRARRLVRLSGLALLTFWVAGVAATTVVRCRETNTAALVTPRGVMMTTPVMQRGFAAAIAFIEERTRPDDFVAVLPEGTSLLFFTDRRNPLHEEITVPGFLDEDRAIRSLAEKPVALVLIAARPTPEYGPVRFGYDYAQRLMRLIEERFVPCGRLGAAKTSEESDSQPLFDAYCAPKALPGSAVARP